MYISNHKQSTLDLRSTSFQPQPTPALAFTLAEYKQQPRLSGTQGANMNQMHPLTECVLTPWVSEWKHSKMPFETLWLSFSPLPLRLFILPSFYLFDIFPPLLWELICQNIPVAHCDRLVNTPIILSASCLSLSSSRGNDTEGLTVQFTRNGWQLSQRRPRASPFLLTFIFTRQARDAAGARPDIHPSRLRRRLLSSSPLLVLWGGMPPLVYVTLSVPPLTMSLMYWWSKSFLHCLPFSSHPPVLHNIMEELLIYMLSWCLAACCRYPLSMPLIYTPPPLLLLNDFLLPLASFPLSSSALHKSKRSLNPSKANDHHLFPSTHVSLSLFFPISPLGRLSFALTCAHTFWYRCAVYMCAHIQYTVHAVLLRCLGTH